MMKFFCSLRLAETLQSYESEIVAWVYSKEIEPILSHFYTLKFRPEMLQYQKL